MKVFNILNLIGVSLVLVVGLSACNKPGPAETAGKKIDQGVDTAGKKIDETADKIHDKLDEKK